MGRVRVPAQFLISVFLFVLGASAAGAQSFDCGKAATALERAICHSPGLARADETLAKAYATALGGLSEEARSAVQRGQRSWHDYAGRVCTENAEPLQGAYDEDGVACLVQTFTSRIHRLEQSRMQSGRRFFPLDDYRVTRDPDATEDSWNKVTAKEFLSLRLDGEDAASLAFNGLMERQDAHLKRSGEEGFDPLTDTATDSTITVTIDSVTPRRISVAVNDWWYGHGAAHGNYAVTYTHFLVAEQRHLRAADIFAGDGWIAALAALVEAELVRNYGELWDEAGEAIAASVGDPERWRFSEDGLTVQFQPYEITAYAAGAPTATLYWHQIGEHLTPEALELAAY